ncbi:MAG: L-serine ammonia-lyase [Pseudomonadota bacterium]
MFSVFDIFKIGLGPSSSHTTGPMRIAKRTLLEAQNLGLLAKTARVLVELQGSLALTGIGHGSDRAAILGLLGHEPETVEKSQADLDIEKVFETKRLSLLGQYEIAFDAKNDIDFRGDIIPKLHPNGMKIYLFDVAGEQIFTRTFYSTGGGFIASEDQLLRPATNDIVKRGKKAQLPFTSAAELLAHCAKANGNIDDVVRTNEDSLRPRVQTDAGLLAVWQAMNASIERGLNSTGILPGGLKVRRRASSLYQKMRENPMSQDLERLFDWLNIYAMAVNEENADGGRVVTAPTNGAAGLIPALIRYYCAGEGWSASDCAANGKIGRFLLVAAGIGMIYKQRASLSGAEMGCQGEVGVACSMGAAGLCAIWGGTPSQIEHAAEIAMEHNLGLTCDPVGGLVQIPCIERNAIGAVKAANAARLAMIDVGDHKVTLDQVIETMRQTGLDMSSKYKETSQGGLAVNVVEC